MNASERLKTVKFAAVDYKAEKYHVSKNGIPEDVEVYGGRSYKYLDLVVADLFREGYDVVTEATTATSYGNDERVGHLEHVLEVLPDRLLFTKATRVARNACRREGTSARGELDDSLAAAAIWRQARRTGVAKVWRPVDQNLKRRRRYDPVRNRGLEVFISLRSAQYPTDRMRDEILRYLLPETLEGYERYVVGTRNGYTPTKAAAFVCACMEDASRKSRKGFEQVIGAYEDAHPSLYRQILVAGARGQGKSYRHGYHQTGILMKNWRQAARGLRKKVVRRLPPSSGAAPPPWYEHRTSAGIPDSAHRADMYHPVDQGQLFGGE